MQKKHALYATLTKRQLFAGIPENWLYVTLGASVGSMYLTFTVSPSSAVKVFLIVAVITWLVGVIKTKSDLDWLDILIARFYTIGNKPKTTEFKGNRYIS